MPRGPSGSSNKVRLPGQVLLQLARDVLEPAIGSLAEGSRVRHVPVVPEIQAGQLIMVTYDRKVTKPRGEDRVLNRHLPGLGQHRLPLLHLCLLYLEDARR